MKNLLSVALLVITFSTNAQMVIKEAVKDSIVWRATKISNVPKLVNFYKQDVNSYTMYYRNGKYTAIVDINYLTLGEKDVAVQFFELLLSVITSGEKVNIELDDKAWIVSKSMNGVSIFSISSSFFLTKNQVEDVLEILR